MTGQSLLDRMELVNQELQLQAGEVDVTRGLLALNVAQDLFESLVATEAEILGSAVSTVVTVALQEYTTFPSGVIRIDGLDYIDPTTLRPAWPLKNLKETGAHAYYGFDNSIYAVNGSDAPQSYWTNGTRIYWSPLPQAVHTVRYYGFAVAVDLTASGTFTYPDIIAFPIAILAAKLMKIGIEDPVQDYTQLATDVVSPAIKALSMYNRDGAKPLTYSTLHET